ncbi:hypothetical protein DPSP01_001320 [Paraphaeosphaeria sporulosa]
MSLDSPRDARFREKKNEIAHCDGSLKRKLRELYRYTALIHTGLPPEVPYCHNNDEPDENEADFLDKNDITKRRRFNDSTLAYPLPLTSPLQKPASPAFAKSSPSTAVGSSLEEQLRAASASPSVATQIAPVDEESTQTDLKFTTKSASLPSGVETPVSASPVDATDHDQTSSEQPQAPSITEAPVVQISRGEKVDSDGQAVDPRAAIPPSSEDTALSENAPVNGRRPKAPKAPQVVHLPPQDVQETRLQETEQKLEKIAEKERKEEERLTLPNGNIPTDLASSPSSTVGPYSQATPHPQHHSPDTSPETESFRERRQSLVDAGLVDPVAEQAKEDHERALQEQMRQARENARADSNAEEDDVERQIEDEQAIRLARDGKARLNESDNAPPAGPEALSDHAKDVVREIEMEQVETAAEQPAADSLPTPTTTAPDPSTAEPETSESAVEEHRQRSSLGPEHPTPPADNDVEMDEAPVPAKEQPASSINPDSESTPTLLSSGTQQQKSIAQIIEERAEKSPAKVVLTPRSSNILPTTSPARVLKEHKRREVSTIIFAKPDLNRATKALQLYNEDYASLQGASQDSSRDYLQGLFNYQAHHPPRASPLMDLVTSARKTVSTAGVLATIREAHDYKILKRVYQLQNANRWSLRQLKKSAEPERPVTHQDHLLAEMKWMQTDFKEERKWKQSLAATFAGWCADYVNSTPEERTSLRIKARIPKSSAADLDMDDAPTPDLVHSNGDAESESYVDDDELLSPLYLNPPASLFSLGFNDVVLKIDRTPASDTLLHELPLYEPILEGASDVTPLSFVDPPLAPVSKFVCGKLVSQVRGPPRKRSRYEYDSEDEPSTPPSRSGTSAEHSMPSTPGRRLFHRNDLPPEMSDVALFHPENRHLAIIDGMRKLARKRESIAHKQAESQKAAALRKAQEPMQPKSNVHTPQEFSRLKWEREQRIKQKLLEQQQQEMHARQMAQRTAQMQAQGLANGSGQQPRMGTPGSNPNLTPQMANAAQQGSNPAANAAMAARVQQNQAMQQGFPNANMNGGMAMGSTGVPQAQMQANMSNSQRMGPPNQAQMAAMQRGQFPNANAQHQFQLQQQQINMASNLTQNMGINNMPNANMMASMVGQNMNGNMTPGMNGMSNNAGSPRINQATPNMQTPARPLSSGHMPQLLQIQNNLKVQHPDWSQEQVQKMASDHLARFLTKQRAQAMNAAAGSPGMAHSPQIGNNMYLQNGNMGANSPSPNAVQHYQQQLVRQQQLMSQQRAQAGSPGMNAARPSSRSATPQNAQLQQSPGVQQAQT